MESFAHPIRLAMIAHRFQRNDGQGLVNYEVARGALERGHHVTLVTAHCADDLLLYPNVQVHFVGDEKRPTQLLKNMSFATQSARWIRAHRTAYDLIQGNGFITWEPCDVITAHFVHSAWIKSPYFPFSGLSLDPYALYQYGFSWLNSRWERRAFATARRVVAVSDMVAQEVRALGVPAERLSVVFNGVDTDEYHPGPAQRESFQLPQGVPLALFVGELRTPRKNLDSVLRAMQSIAELHLVVAGDDKDSPFPLLAKELGVSARVHFLGKIRNIADLMRSVDLFVFPSRYDTYGLVVLEAMASSLPVIISSNVGAAGLLGETCQVIQDPDDVDALTRCIQHVLASSERRKQMGEAARAKALTLQWASTVDRYLELYESLVREPSSPRHALQEAK